MEGFFRFKAFNHQYGDEEYLGVRYNEVLNWDTLKNELQQVRISKNSS
jgi:hypothetical protein